LAAPSNEAYADSAAQATITVNLFESPVANIQHAGVPQGSPLSPILYPISNADLVDEAITDTKGAIEYVDDFTRWTVGSSTDATTAILQRKVVPKALRWAQNSGASFEA
jgi:hypothetical protein